MARLAFLAPNQIDEITEPYVRMAQDAIKKQMTENELHRIFPPEEDYKMQQQYAKEYDDNPSLHRFEPGQYVLLDLPPEAMSKSYD